eukprot:4390150-Amphidinium_carterae.1
MCMHCGVAAKSCTRSWSCVKLRTLHTCSGSADFTLGAVWFHRLNLAMTDLIDLDDWIPVDAPDAPMAEFLQGLQGANNLPAGQAEVGCAWPWGAVSGALAGCAAAVVFNKRYTKPKTAELPAAQSGLCAR